MILPTPRLVSVLVILVMAAPPDACLVASLGGAVEPVVHAKERIDAACISGIGVVDNAVLERKRAHARPIAMVPGHVGSRHGRELGLHRVAATLLTSAPPKYVARRQLTPVVVIGARALLVLGERDVEVEVEVATVGGRP